MEEITEDVVLPDGTRRLRVVGDAPINAIHWAARLPDEAVRVAEVVTSEDRGLGIYSLTMTWPAREAVAGVVWPDGTRMERPLVMWRLAAGERVRDVMRLGAEVFERTFGRRPGVAWVRSMPKGLEELETVEGYVVEAVQVEGVSLRLAEWAFPGCVFIGG